MLRRVTADLLSFAAAAAFATLIYLIATRGHP